MVLALETSKSSSRTMRTRSLIWAFVSLISLSALAEAALDAFLLRFSVFLGSWDQQTSCEPCAAFSQRSPFAVIARHWLICDLPFYFERVGGRSGLYGESRCRSP